VAISFINSAASSGTSTAVSITHGLTLADGDTLVALISNTGYAANSVYTSDSSRFTSAYRWLPGSGTVGSGAIWTRTITNAAGEDAAYGWTSAVSYGWSCQVFQFRGVHADIWDVAPAVGNVGLATSAQASAPSIDVVTSGAMGLLFATVVSSTHPFLSNPSNSYGDEIETTAGRVQALYRRASLSTGATGATTVDLASSDDWGICQCALKPATGAAVVTSGLVAEYVGKLAKNGTAPGNNVDPTSTWDDLKGAYDGTLTVFRWDSTSGWSGSGSESAPYALYSDGAVGNKVSLGDISLSEDRTFSYEVWAKVTAKTANGFLISEAGGGTGASFLRVDMSTGYIVFRVTNDAASVVSVTSTTDVTASGGYHHIVGTCDGSTMTLYINTTSEGSPSAPPSTPISLTSAWLCNLLGGGNPFGGSLATARFYNRALSATEVLQNFNAGVRAASTDATASDRTALIQFGIC